MLEFNEYLEFAQSHGFASLFDENDNNLDQQHIERLLERATARPIGVARYSYAIPDAIALNILAAHGPIIEIGAGTGYWAHLLRRQGVDVIAFDTNPPLTEAHTNHYHRNGLIAWTVWTEVLTGGPELAAHYPERSLFLCWPPPRESMAADALGAYEGSTVIFIGEWNPATAADAQFYDALERWQLETIYEIPRWFGMKDRLSVWRRETEEGKQPMTDLTKLAQLAEAQAALLAGRVASYAQANQLDDAALAARLGCSPADVNRLKLCRVPLNDTGFAQIVAYTGCNADQLRLLLDTTEPGTDEDQAHSQST